MKYFFDTSPFVSSDEYLCNITLLLVLRVINPIK